MRKEIKQFKEDIKKVNTIEELDELIGDTMLDALGFIPFYVEIKPGFIDDKYNILNMLTYSRYKDPDKISPLLETTLFRSRKFNEAFYPHLIDAPNNLFDDVNNLMCGNLPHPYYADGRKLTTGEEGNVGYVFTGTSKGVIKAAREKQGSTGDPAKGTIREVFALQDPQGNRRPHKTANVMHCSDSFLSATKELEMAVVAPEHFDADGKAKFILGNPDNALLLYNFIHEIYKPVVAKEKEILEKQKEASQEKAEEKLCPAAEGIQKLIAKRKAEKEKAEVKNTSAPKGQDNPGGEGR